MPASPQASPPKNDSTTPAGNSLLRILEWPSALGLGGLAAFIFSLKQVNPEVRFEWNAWSFVVLMVATPVFYVLVRQVLRAGGRLLWFAIILVVATGISFTFALKDISPAKRLDVIVGAGSAFVFVALALYGFWRLVQFLERHGLPEEQAYHDESEPPAKKDSPP